MEAGVDNRRRVSRSAAGPTRSSTGSSMPTPERRWFEEWRAGGLGCVNCHDRGLGERRRDAGAARQVAAAASRRTATSSRRRPSVDEIEAIRKSGRTAIVFGFQNTAPVEHNLDLFGAFRDLGVCIMQLTYNLQNYIGCGYWEENDTGISSRFGRKALEEMNRVGILIDLSHCGERTTLEAIETSARPVAITHANPREYVGTGVYGAGRAEDHRGDQGARAARRGVIGLSPNRNMTKRGAATTLEEFGDMVAWVVDRIGVDAVGDRHRLLPGPHRRGAHLVALRALVARERAGRADDDGAARGLVGVGEDAGRRWPTSSRSSRGAASRPTRSRRSWAATGCACSPRRSSPRDILTDPHPRRNSR